MAKKIVFNSISRLRDFHVQYSTVKKISPQHFAYGNNSYESAKFLRKIFISCIVSLKLILCT